jgi:hypothetical protein
MRTERAKETAKAMLMTSIMGLGVGAAGVGVAPGAHAASGRCSQAFGIAQELVRGYVEGDYDAVVTLSKTRRSEARAGKFTPARLLREWGLTDAYLEEHSCTVSRSIATLTMSYYTDEPKQFCVQWTVDTNKYEVTRERTLRSRAC